MILREVHKSGFILFTADVKVKHQFYSQIIPVQVSARNAQEARKLIQQQYGSNATVTGIRKSK